MKKSDHAQIEHKIQGLVWHWKGRESLQCPIYSNGQDGHQLSKVEACFGHDGVDSIAFCVEKLVSPEPVIVLHSPITGSLLDRRFMFSCGFFDLSAMYACDPHTKQSKRSYP